MSGIKLHSPVSGFGIDSPSATYCLNAEKKTGLMYERSKSYTVPVYERQSFNPRVKSWPAEGICRTKQVYQQGKATEPRIKPGQLIQQATNQPTETQKQRTTYNKRGTKSYNTHVRHGKRTRIFKCLIVPLKDYPKYRYMYNEAKPLCTRFCELLKKLGLIRNQFNFPCQEIRILCVEEEGSQNLSTVEISQSSDKDMKFIEIPSESVSDETEKASVIVVSSNALVELQKQEIKNKKAQVIILESDRETKLPEGYVTSTREQLAATIETCLQNKIKLSFENAWDDLQSDELYSNEAVEYDKQSGEREDASSMLNVEDRRDKYTPKEKELGSEETKVVQQGTKAESKCASRRHQERLTDAYRRNPELKEDAKQLYGSINSMLYRCGMPTERNIKDSYKVLSEEAADSLFQTKGVIRLGYKFRTLNVYLDDSLDPNHRQEVESDVTKILKDLGIFEYKILYEQKNLKYFAEVGSRLKVESLDEDSSIVRVGGFAELGQDKQLCILLSGHATPQRTENVYVEEPANSGTFVPFGRVLLPKTQSPKLVIDISIAEVTKNVQQENRQLKDSYGKNMPNQLFSFEQDDAPMFLNSLPVHIARASESPGLGVISIPFYKTEGMENKIIEIEDREPDEGKDIKRFAFEGDSGSIVCANDVSGKKVHAIGMLIGSLNNSQVNQTPSLKTKYAAFRLQDGIEKIKSEQEEPDLFLC